MHQTLVHTMYVTLNILWGSPIYVYGILLMDFGHQGYQVLCCGGLLDGFNNCTIQLFASLNSYIIWAMIS